MEDGVGVKRWPEVKMAMLLSRKQELEELLAVRNEELRKLCIQEAELTGIMPAEVPVEPGELPPTFRRRVGTAYTYPQNLINKIRTVTDAESIAALELERQVQAGISEAALGLINKGDASKAVRRKNRSVYQQSQRKLRELEERLGLLTSRSLTRLPQHSQDGGIHHLSQAKCKKKPRPPVDHDRLEDNHSGVSGNSEHSERSSGHMRHVLQHDRLERSRSHTESGTVYNAQMHQQLAPYQQYEAGLGGYWMSLDTGETVWCHAEDNHWHLDDRFSSLDRSKTRPLQHKWSSPGAIETSNQKNSTCNMTVPEKNIQERIRPSHHHHTLKNIHHTRGSPELTDTWHLTRTQSMGSVDVTTDESCYRERMGSRKYKQKKWYETSLDGPQPTNINQTLPYPNTSSKSHPQIRSTVTNHPSTSPAVSPVQQSLSHQQAKPVTLESPQSSTPPRITLLLETNLDALTSNFNNSNTVPVQSPKNCTVIEPGQWKPYREVTKPFEMSDFYKYSTKFKNRQNVVDDNSNQHQSKPNMQEKSLGPNDHLMNPSHQITHIQNVESNFESLENGVDALDGSLSPLFQKGMYQPLQPMKCQAYQYSTSSNQIHGMINVGQGNSDNTVWGQHSNKPPSHLPGTHKMCNNSNLNSSPKNSVNSRSTATLV